MTPRLTGAVAGLLNGLIGLGGGIVIVPAMLSRGAAPAQAVGTALVAVVAFSTIGLLVHGSLGGLVLAPVSAAVLLLCGVAGSLLGARLLAGLSVPRMHALFALLMFTVSLRLLLQGLGLGVTGAIWPGTPDIAGLAVVGAVCGVLSGVFGVGGGALVLLGLATLYGVSVQDGLPLTLAGEPPTTCLTKLLSFFLPGGTPLAPASST